MPVPMTVRGLYPLRSCLCAVSTTLVIVAAAASASRAAPVDTFLLTDRTSPAVNEPYYSESGTSWQDGSSGAYWVDRSGRVEVGSNAASAQWTPGLNAGFTNGMYTVQVHWAANHPTFTTTATYTVTDASAVNYSVNINQKLYVDQGSLPANNLHHPSQPAPSGWYTLGFYSLNAASTISVSKPANSGTLCADDVRIAAGRDVILDENAVATTTAVGLNWTEGTYALPSPSESSTFGLLPPAAGNQNAATTYSLGGMTGASDVYISWGVGITANNNHQTAAPFVLALDGNFANNTPGNLITYLANENLTATGGSNTSSTNDAWSGWALLGSGVNLTANSKVRVTGSSTLYTTADALRVVSVPEPSVTITALVTSGAMAAHRRRRSQT
jgi:hypothetical protein